MRLLTTCSMVLILLTTQHVSGQCQGSRREGSQHPAPFTQAGGLTQVGNNPALAFQLAAMRQARLQQQFALQPLRMQQLAWQQLAREAKLARRRDAAQQRRAAELARREQVRSENLARFHSIPSQAALVRSDEE